MEHEMIKEIICYCESLLTPYWDILYPNESEQSCPQLWWFSWMLCYLSFELVCLVMQHNVCSFLSVQSACLSNEGQSSKSMVQADGFSDALSEVQCYHLLAKNGTGNYHKNGTDEWCCNRSPSLKGPCIKKIQPTYMCNRQNTSCIKMMIHTQIWT